MTQAYETALSDIAIIGMACRFSDAADYDSFRSNLTEGRESVGRPTREELLTAGVPPSLLDDPNYVFAGAPLAGLADFDAEFFGMSPREAEVTDPQHRLFLECAWQALEDSGQIAAAAGQLVGVWGGTGTSLYLLQNLQHAQTLMDAVGGLGATLGSKADFLTLRVSHKLDLRGPSFNVQSGCSTGLVAVHCAVQSLLAGECQLALAGAACLTQLNPGGYMYHSGSIESRDGHCRAFDADAGGTTRGSGAGMVVLKRLADAIADGDPIHAVIKATATNNDGADKIGMTAPSELGQAAVISEALALAGLNAEDIGCIEAHGTGTALGDPIEVAALTRVFRQHTQRQGFCAIGSVKSNLGHLDASAGIASLIKAVLMVKYREIYPTLHFRSPNPEINFAVSPLYVARQYQAWSAKTPRAGVSSFGMGGTNVHAVLEAPPDRVPRKAYSGPVLMVLSARSVEALNDMSLALAQALENRPDLALADVARTLQTGRRHWAVRRHVVATTANEAIEALRRGTSGQAFDDLSVIGAQWCSGASVDWRALPGAEQTQHVHLPTYPFQRKRHWVEGPRANTSLTAPVWTQQRLPCGTSTADKWWLVAPHTHIDDAHHAAAQLRQAGGDVLLINDRPDELILSGSVPDYVVAWCQEVDAMRLLTRLADYGPAAPVRVLLLCSGTVSLLGTETIHAGQAFALAEAMNWRHPLVSVATLDVPADGTSHLPLAQLIAIDPARMAWRGRRCFVQAWQPLPRFDSAPIAPGGEYVVHPGLNPLGLQAARALAQSGAKQVTLVDTLPPAAFVAEQYLENLEMLAGVMSEHAPSPLLQAALDKLAAACTCRLLRAAGYALVPGDRYGIPDMLTRIAPCPPYPRMLRAQLADLAHDNLVRIEGNTLHVLPAMVDTKSVQSWCSHIAECHPEHSPIANLLVHCANQHAAVFAGRLPGTSVAASKEGEACLLACADVIEKYSTRAHCLRAVSMLVRDLAQGATPPLRILEVGGGRGGLTRRVISRLGNHPVEYCFTDISISHVRTALHEAEHRNLRGFRAQRFDINSDPTPQGLEPESFDLVLGLDVVHATPCLQDSLSNLRRLLRSGGLLCLIERTQVQRWVEHVWGLETGWWHFEDEWRADSPLTGRSQWHSAMKAAGLTPRMEGPTSALPHDTSWLLAERPSDGASSALLTQLAAHQANCRSAYDAFLEECSRLGTRAALVPTNQLSTLADQPVSIGIHVGDTSVDGAEAEAFIEALRSTPPLILLVSARGQSSLAKWHAAIAEGRSGVIAWSEVSQIDLQQLTMVASAGACVVAGQSAFPSTAMATPMTDDARPDNSAHSVITRLWLELLGVESVAPDDDWYALGGDSLLTTRAITLLEQRFRVTLPVDRFFNATTVSAMTEALTDALAAVRPNDQDAEDALLSQIEAMSDADLKHALQHEGNAT